MANEHWSSVFRKMPVKTTMKCRDPHTNISAIKKTNQMLARTQSNNTGREVLAGTTHVENSPGESTQDINAQAL